MRIGILMAGLLLAGGFTAIAQPSSGPEIARALDEQACVERPGLQVQVCRYDFRVDTRAVEAILFRPLRDGRHPGVLLIPGFQRTARDQINLGVRLASEGFAAASVTQPGFGRSDGPPDYVGPVTLKVLTEAYNRLKREAFVDPQRMGIYGFSRGGMAASLLATQLDDVKAAVFGAGIYDFRQMYQDAELPGMRANMKAETGMTGEAVRERSSVLRMEKLMCPVLILHGEADKNVPVSQANLLQDRLKQLHKEYEIRLFPGREHGIGPEVGDLTVDFFKRRLEPAR